MRRLRPSKRTGPGKRRRPGHTRLALFCLLAAVALAALASGCGGSDSSSSGSTHRGSTSTAAEETTTTAKQETKPSKSESESKPSGGGERSVQGFGSEAEGSDRDQALAAFHAYLGAIAARDYATACAHLSKVAVKSLAQIATPKLRAKGCAAILPKLLSSSAAPIAGRQNGGEVTRVRVKGDQAFVLYRAPGARLWVLTLAREGGEWKATTLSGSILVPDPASIGAAP